MDIKSTETTPPQYPAKRTNVWLPLALAGSMVVGMLAGAKLKQEPNIKRIKNTSETSELSENERFGNGRIEEILRYIDAKYVENVGDEKLTESAISSLLADLDPHSEYIPADKVQSVNEDLEGEFDGIGVSFVIVDDTVNVETPIAGTPAEKAGLMAGDKILKIGDSVLMGKKLNDDYVTDCLKGKRGTRISLDILRGEDNQQRRLSLMRERVPDRSIEIGTMLDPKTGYVRINRFSQRTFQEFLTTVGNLVEKYKMKDLVIDLRGNPGGYLEQAVEILSQIFDEKDKTLVYTKGRESEMYKQEYKSTGRNHFEIDKVVVLIDEGSASAAEIVAGALQDWDRGVVIGRRSFGKGLVQEQYSLKNGSALRLTVAKYYTPSGRSIQKMYKNKTRAEYDREEIDRLNSPEMYSSDSIKIEDKHEYRTKAGRIVYGGGGIIPDYFVPKEMIFQNEFYLKAAPFLNEFAYKLLSQNRKSWRFKDFADLEARLKISDAQINDFFKYVERRGVNRNGQGDAVRSEVRRQLKARVAQQFFGDQGFFAISRQSDACIERALNILRLNDPLNLQKTAKKQ
ncbi:MAG: hypothetical protein RL757_408 [Bacteroidota bacterium]|jgi:carboxyl-terminal processing protease